MRNAVAIELSAGGLRLVGDEDLPADRVIAFRFTLPNELIRGIEVEKEIEEIRRGVRTKKRILVPVDPFGEMRIRGKTVVAFFHPRARTLAHGVQFIDLDDRTREELQRFIHVLQIRKIRERAQLRGD